MSNSKKTILLIVFTLCLCSVFYAQSNDTLSYNPKGKAILASAVVPGWGQHILKNSQKAEIMIAADGVLWLLYGGFQWYGSSRLKDAKLYASRHADANINIANEKYYRALERYRNSEDYNEDIRREARERFPDNPLLQHNYFLENGYFGDSAWLWQSDSMRFSYWEQRKVARTALTRAGFCLGAVILNRVVSSIDAAFFTEDLRDKVGFAPNQAQNGIGLIYRF
ncbi:MAG: hypothetical protein KGZ86_06095 [Candidatus Latescibacteria bacterium]|nr:hypothetical protein [Candidatus Latescibacterota bacterium]